MKHSKVRKETILLKESLDRIIASDIVSNVNIPNSNRAAMDGYAVIAEDTFGSSENNPVILEVVGKVRIGEIPSIIGGPRKAIGVATGSNIPKGTDAVVMIEYTKVEKNNLYIVKPVVPWQNVSKIGEDVNKRQVVVKKGIRTTPQDIGILAALGYKKVTVMKKPRVAAISTGDELIDPGEIQKDAKIYDINRHMTMASIIKMGGEPYDLGIVKDDYNEIEIRLKKAIAKADIVTISAGTSVGEKDIVPSVLGSLSGKNDLIHGVSLRPGYPTGLIVIDGKPIVSLPGYPVSNAVAFRVFLRPLISYLLETEENIDYSVKAKLSRRVANIGGLRTFVRVRLFIDQDKWIAEPIMASGAGVISSLTGANALLIIPEDKEGIDEGDEVEVILLRPLKAR